MIDKLDALRDCLYRVIENGIIELRGNDLEALVDLATWAVNEIAALREARDALPVAGGADFTLEPSDIEPDEALQDAELNRLLQPAAPNGKTFGELRQMARDFYKRDATPSRTPAAPEPDAPPLRLTRAQRDALALLDKHNFFESEYINEHTLKALQRRGLVTYSRDWHGLAYITDAGRDALRDAGARDDIEQLRQDVRDAQAVVDDLMAQPNPLDAPAAPVRETPRLTRAQMRALTTLYDAATMAATEFWQKYPNMSGELKRMSAPDGFVLIDRYDFGIHKPQAAALVAAGYAERKWHHYDMGGTSYGANCEGLRITPLGRAALAAAQRGDGEAE